MLNERELSAAIGSTAYDADGDKIGTVEHFFADDRTGAPTWVAVTTGLFGTKHSVVPAAGATFGDGALRVPVRKEAVRDAPRPTDSAHLDPGTEAELRRHYGLDPAAAPGGLPPGAQPPVREDPSGRHAALDDAEHAGPRAAGEEPPGPVPVPDREVAEAHGSGPTTDGTMTRSEEQLRVSTRRVPAGRVRLVKYVVTEEVQVTVPIRREEVRLEELPAGSEDQPAATGESLLPPDAEHGQGHGPSHGQGHGLPEEIVLHAERPVVTVEVVPVERVRVRTETVSDQEHVTEQVQREQIAVDET